MVGLYVLATGELRSVGTAPAEVPAGHAVRPLPPGAQYGVTHEWDASTADWTPKRATFTTQLTPGDFMRPLGAREAILHRVRIDPTADLTLRGNLEWLHSWLLRVAQTYVDLNDPIVPQGVAVMAQVLDAYEALPEGEAAFTATMMAPRVVR